MQYSLSKLNPDTLQALKETLDEPSNVDEFLEKLRKFLGGDGKSVAEQDLAFSTASELSAAGVFDALQVTDLAAVLGSVEKSKAFAFKSGLARRYRAALDELGKVAEASVVVKRPARKVVGTMKLQIPARQATPSPPVGPALGQRGINIMEFCKAFNAKTQEMDPGAPCPTVITYYQDKSFTIDVKTPPASYFLKKAAGLKPVGKLSRSHGSVKMVRGAVATVTEKQVREIAEAKMKDLSFGDIEAAIREVFKDAAEMGITIKKQ